jgi:hypothetical protein
MNTQANAVVVVDGFDIIDPTASPIHGLEIRFKDGHYYNFKEKMDVRGRDFVVLDRVEGWQKLEKGCAPEYLMQKLGEPKPPQPHVDEKDWPLDLNNEPKHPWKWTRFLYLLDKATGESSTFSSNNIGGHVGIDELRDQITDMRRMRPGAIPIVALQSKEMPTSYGGTKPRPYFKIQGWKIRDDLGPQSLLAGPQLTDVEKPTTEELLDDELPTFDRENA